MFEYESVAKLDSIVWITRHFYHSGAIGLDPANREALEYITVQTVLEFTSSLQEEVSRLGVINAITEISEISLEKLVAEINKDPELGLLRQAKIDNNMDHVTPHYQHKRNHISVEYRLVFLVCLGINPDRMQEWILQMAHGNHESPDKMTEICQRVYWEDKNEDIKAKLTFF